jgi:hypothetical protein
MPSGYTYAPAIAGEIRRPLDALGGDPVHRRRYTSFVADMVHGERAEFDAAMTTVTAAVEAWLGP